MIRILPAILFTCLASVQVFADMVHIPADRDNTLIEDPDGALSNGTGLAFFAGRTNQSMFSIRRGTGALRRGLGRCLPTRSSTACS